MQRRDFLNPFKKKSKQEKDKIIRPPYYDDTALFDKECIECDGACSTFCQEEIIKIREDKTPEIIFNTNGCTYCDDCAIACQRGVLKVENRKNIDVKISINMLKCFSWNETMCFSCKEPCLDNAIDFLGMFRPEINLSKCTSCGFCISVCPANAIEIK